MAGGDLRDRGRLLAEVLIFLRGIMKSLDFVRLPVFKMEIETNVCEGRGGGQSL